MCDGREQSDGPLIGGAHLVAGGDIPPRSVMQHHESGTLKTEHTAHVVTTSGSPARVVVTDVETSPRLAGQSKPGGFVHF